MIIGKIQEFKKQNPVLWVTVPREIREFANLIRGSQVEWQYFEKDGQKVIQITKHEE